MKTKDFEKAIDELGCAIEIDDIKLHGGNVRVVYAHTSKLSIMWDENGRGFSAARNEQPEMFIEEGSGNLVPGLRRDPKFDLKFE